MAVILFVCWKIRLPVSLEKLHGITMKALLMNNKYDKTSSHTGSIIRIFADGDRVVNPKESVKSSTK